jgi:hypothetical protein
MLRANRNQTTDSPRRAPDLRRRRRLRRRLRHLGALANRQRQQLRPPGQRNCHLAQLLPTKRRDLFGNLINMDGEERRTYPE